METTTAVDTSLAELMLDLFRGREDHIAFHNGRNFEPKHLTHPLQCYAERFTEVHLSGTNCLGFYLMDVDSKVRATCVDFDNKPTDPDPNVFDKASQLYFWLCQSGLRPIVERSQSGTGAHVWLFFQQPVAASIVRSWWTNVSNRLNIPFREIYPRQSQHTGKGMGSLVRFPLWNKSAFVDPESEFSMLDALATLQSVEKINPTDLTLLAAQLGFGLLNEDRPKASGGMSGRVQALVSHPGSLLGKRWRGDTSGMKDGSKSALAESICCELVRLYVPTIEIESALKRWCADQCYDKGLRDDWIQTTVQNAYEFVIDRTERKSTITLTMKGATEAYLAELEQGEIKPIPCGVNAVDRSVDGVRFGEVCVIGARPSHGKSAFAAQWLEHAASLGIPGMLFSEEMSAKQVGKRRLQGLSLSKANHWTRQHVSKLRRLAEDRYKTMAPTYVVENSQTIDRVEEIIVQFAAIHNVKIVAIDYLQLLTCRGSSRYEQVTEMSRRLKQLAGRLEIAILLLAQVGRDVEKEGYRRPRMADLKESGQIEQDADLILFLTYLCKVKDAPETAFEIICAKRRDGEIRAPIMDLCFDAPRQLFY